MSELTEDRPAAATRRSAHAVAVLLLALLFTLLWTSERSRSPTIDEPLHLIRGLAVWSAGDTRLSFAHPPLANALAALPAFGDADFDVEALRGWDRANLRAVAEAHFHADYGAARKKLHRARTAIMISSLLLGGILYAWCTTRWGERTGLIALSLYTLHPTLLAHGRLMTTDMPLALAGFLALIAMIHWVETPGRAPLVLFCAAAALVVGVKHSGGPILVLLCGLGAVVAWRGGGRFQHDSRRRRLVRFGRETALAALVTLLAINAWYLFQGTGWSVDRILTEPEPTSWVARRAEGKVLTGDSVLARLPGEMRVPLPFSYLVGIATISGQNAIGHGKYFFGMNETAGHWAYFPVLTLIKTPLGLLVLLTVAAILVATQRARPSRATWLCAGFVLAFFLMACNSRINIGVRHVLVTFPVLAVLAARAGDRLWTGRVSGRALLIGCLASCALGALSTFPRYLGDFNLLAGGPRGGLRVSVVGEDWGQGVAALAESVRDRELEPLYYYTNNWLRLAELRHQGIEVRRIPCNQAPNLTPSWVAVHITNLVRQRDRCFGWLEGRKFVIVDDHIYVFLWDP